MIKKLLLACIIVLLAGCASKILKPEPLTKENLSGNNAVLIGSFARNPEAPAYYSQTFYFRNVETKKVHEIKSQQEFNIFTGKTPDEFSTDNDAGATFAFRLPAGKYVLYNFSLYRPAGYFYSYYFSKADFAIPFDVYPNKANYLGQLKLEGATGKNLFHMSVPAGGIWVISDQRERDLQLLRSTMPSLPLDDVVSVIPTKKEIFTPLVILPNEARVGEDGHFRASSFYDTAAPYAKRLREAIRIHLVTPDLVDQNSRVEVEVFIAPDGAIQSYKLIRSEGSPQWEAAVLSAMEKSDRLPLDTNGKVPDRMKLVFVP